ncbi:hypothetical protein [Vitiosangium sp. GDMCC 1.1324]|uniref:hypothetical protein n=1 Tax=Vitiosangium sp. (strain GDMCC 1.1324) TaxID=2138576 RepID=UPI000D3911A4|nr:hypothetical protein [Vitiosangium sp. GDMCC 1.1324]PTL80652.1 hypothetical protein DAT35_28935 [Vitiosangium sp. GDMCC 1.1324]
MPAQPAIRGFMSRMILEAARSLPADKKQRVFALVPQQVIALIDATPRLGWVPLEENMKLSGALHQVLGNPGFRQFFSSLSERMLTYPLLQSFFDGAVRLFGLTPQALLKWTTYAWEQAFRDCGKIRYQPHREAMNHGRVTMVLEGFPPAQLRTGTFIESLAGTFDMYLRRVSKKGWVEIHDADKDKGLVAYEISWE